jgi:hypothetical protein
VPTGRPGVVSQGAERWMTMARKWWGLSPWAAVHWQHWRGRAFDQSTARLTIACSGCSPGLGRREGTLAQWVTGIPRRVPGYLKPEMTAVPITVRQIR